MQICSNRCCFVLFCFVFLPVQIDTHAGLKGQEVTCSLLPLDYWPHGLVCQGVTGHSVGGGGGSGHCLSWEMWMLLFLSTFITFPSAAELLHLKKKKKERQSFSYQLVKRSCWRLAQLMFYIEQRFTLLVYWKTVKSIDTSWDITERYFVVRCSR